MASTQKAKDELQKLVKLFESGEAPKALATVTLISPDFPSYRWTLSNRLMAFFQCLETDSRGFRQWEAVKRRVKKGASAVYILRPHTIKDLDKKTGEEITRCIGFGCLPVFPYTATEGEPLPELLPMEPPPLMDVANAFGVKIDYQAHVGGFLGAYQQDKEKIVLVTHSERVFFHELAHSAHKRVLGELKNCQDPFQEIVAELSASVLCRLYGRQMANEGASFEYIKSYVSEMKKDLASCLVSVLGEVEKVLELIINTNQAVEIPQAI